jgi:hypothetical protein
VSGVGVGWGVGVGTGVGGALHAANKTISVMLNRKILFLISFSPSEKVACAYSMYICRIAQTGCARAPVTVWIHRLTSTWFNLIIAVMLQWQRLSIACRKEVMPSR